jgi:hypothetical protein
MLPDRVRWRLRPKRSARSDAAVGDSILFKPDLSLAHIAERLRASFRPRTRGLRFFASSREQMRASQVRSASDHQTIPSTSGERASLAQCAPQHLARLRERHATVVRPPLHTIQFTASQLSLSEASVACALESLRATVPAFRSTRQRPSSQERLQSQCQKS